jgi:hypothetical protein
MMDAAQSSETSEQTCYPAFCNILEDHHLNSEYHSSSTLFTEFLWHIATVCVNAAEAYLLWYKDITSKALCVLLCTFTFWSIVTVVRVSSVLKI